MTTGLMSCMTISFSILANHQIRHQATCKKGSQTGDGHFLSQGLCGYVQVNTLTLSLEDKKTNEGGAEKYNSVDDCVIE